MEGFDFNNSINVRVIFDDSNDKLNEEVSEENCVQQNLNVDKTLSFDKFRDFVSDPIVTPVRETCAQPLGDALVQMTELKVETVSEQINAKKKLNSELTRNKESNLEKNKNNVSNNNEFPSAVVVNNKTKKSRYSLKENEEKRSPTKSKEESNFDHNRDPFRENENSMLKMVSEHLLFIMNAYNVYLTKTKNFTKRFEDETWQAFLRVKYQIYALLYSTNVAILLPREADTEFVKSFINHTLEIANNQKISCTYKHFEGIFNEMLIWTKKKQKHLKNIKIACDTALANASTKHITNQDFNAQLIPECTAKNNNDNNKRLLSILQNTPSASVVPHHSTDGNENQHVNNHSMSTLQNTPTAPLLPYHFTERTNNQHVNNRSMSNLQAISSAPLLPNYFAERNNDRHVVNNHSISNLQNTSTAPLLPNYFAERTNNQHVNNRSMSNLQTITSAPLLPNYFAERNNDQRVVNNHSMSNLQNTSTVPLLPSYFAEHNNDQHGNILMSSLLKKRPTAPTVSDYCAERNNNQYVNNLPMSNLQNTTVSPESLQTCIFSGGEPGKEISINVDKRFLVNQDGVRSKNPIGEKQMVNCINSQFSNSPSALPTRMSPYSSRNLQEMPLNSQQLQTEVQPLMSKNNYANPYIQHRNFQADQQNGMRLVNRNFQNDHHRNCVSHNDFHRIRPRPPPPPPNVTPIQLSQQYTTNQNNTPSMLVQNNNTKSQHENVRSTSTDSGFLSPHLESTSAETEHNTLGNIATPVITHITSLNQNVAHNAPGACHVCKKLTSHKCMECYRNYYCSTECQTIDWNIHKNNCHRS